MENKTLLRRNPGRDCHRLDIFHSECFGRGRTICSVADIADMEVHREPPIKIEAPCAFPAIGWIRKLLV